MNNNDVVLSVTVLSYNNSPYIIDCLNSIANQGIDAYEVFVIDDSSTDDSVEQISEFIKSHPEFSLICKPNSGGAISSQIGINKSSGKYCAIVDSDDIVAKGAYKKLIQRIEEDSSDFAAGMPAKLNKGFMYSDVQHIEASLFSSNRVLSTVEEKADLSKQVYYWNCVYRTDFLKSNNIYMPSNLLIADRVFLYKAIMCANRISIDTQIVYYWRQKANSERASITDNTARYDMIADRCDSFAAQVRISIEGNIEMNEIIWTNSISRLYYPFNHLDYDEMNIEGFSSICDIYRLALFEYPSFYYNLVETSNMPIKDKVITVLLLDKKYEDLLNFFKSGSVINYIKNCRVPVSVQKYLCGEICDVYVTELCEYDNHPIIRFGFGKNQIIRRVESIITHGRYFNHDETCIPVDDAQYVDVSCLPIGMYSIRAKCYVEGREDIQSFNLATGKLLSKRLELHHNNLIYVYHPGISCIKVIKPNAFTLLKSKERMYLRVNNVANFVKKMFYYNIEHNKIIDIDYQGSGVFLIDYDSLPDGSNIILYETTEGQNDVIDVLSLSNSQQQLIEYRDVINKNRIELTK